jgi:hypothetical protein
MLPLVPAAAIDRLHAVLAGEAPPPPPAARPAKRPWWKFW